MTTITLKINERTKAGKTLLAMLNFFTTEKQGVEVCSMPNFETIKAMYDAKILHTIMLLAHLFMCVIILQF
jgi:hypothetical protein